MAASFSLVWRPFLNMKLINRIIISTQEEEAKIGRKILLSYFVGIIVSEFVGTVVRSVPT